MNYEDLKIKQQYYTDLYNVYDSEMLRLRPDTDGFQDRFRDLFLRKYEISLELREITLLIEDNKNKS